MDKSTRRSKVLQFNRRMENRKPGKVEQETDTKNSVSENSNFFAEDEDDDLPF